ncbi:hypothetical protein L2E82_45800 [Cichorium intybus]|uniref:Uncharacterized protein n=1 Tax=Cichorium intybus TaxID=13427 RepID=A0ACB8ZYD5_CICIN|nr:hypothetical protein L2E82_45800 [Cichorium intybus]
MGYTKGLFSAITRHGEPIVKKLAAVFDKLPAFSSTKAKGLIERELGAPVHELFKEFEDQPIAAASLGQMQSEVVEEIIYGLESAILFGTQDTGHRTQDTGHRTQDTGHRTQDTGHRTQDTGHRTQDTGHRTQDTGHRTQDTGHRTQDTGHRTQDTGQDTGHRTQDTGHRTQDTGHRTQDTGHRTQDRICIAGAGILRIAGPGLHLHQYMLECFRICLPDLRVEARAGGCGVHNNLDEYVLISVKEKPDASIPPTMDGLLIIHQRAINADVDPTHPPAGENLPVFALPDDSVVELVKQVGEKDQMKTRMSNTAFRFIDERVSKIR